eukprot:CAMPEP_0197924580 /NCGR_PEP_ID=MMETSP1439-20131203/95958_1 /TAXON_ID=66791 /ORGANISM="Gonyaulax spinifera, Strain CCMP409" /LENGTH=59 /DNA_ID=CAMNT_0043547017 /DNA_START=27 /DNA_END=202 /DNA_ORIENTATION=-
MTFLRSVLAFFLLLSFFVFSRFGADWPECCPEGRASWTVCAGPDMAKELLDTRGGLMHG